MGTDGAKSSDDLRIQSIELEKIRMWIHWKFKVHPCHLISTLLVQSASPALSQSWESRKLAEFWNLEELHV